MLKQELIDSIIKEIKHVADVEKIIIYGSWARGNNKKHYDIDIAVVIKNGNLAVIKDALEENARTLLKFDAHNYNELPDNIKSQIDKEDIVIYEKI
ncbi:MAG TPA: nucleotidyltransferase domain-containing protein [bacterium]|nr:nucleotidyltransferase domain-containing protein [bacterium]